MEIGSKIRQSRNEAEITQEQAAEALDVSRQTISNWENGKSYPDIVSVLKMSNLYDVSLDYLLKGEETMNSYMDYLDESTNVVKSNQRKGKIYTVLAYIIVWAIAMIAFWVFTADEDAIGYSIMYLWIILPVTTFVVSLIIGRNDYWGNKKWITAAVMGIMYMLAEYGTFSLANNIEFDKVNPPEWGMIVTGAVISLVGLGIGHLLGNKKTIKE